jgi:histidyl-tRNA synthetase
VIDPAITRGLDYYTGLVFETLLDDMPSIGSVCSGGRYDNLSGLYSKEALSGVGSSIGLDRLLAALEAPGKTAKRKTYSELAVICTVESRGGVYQRIAQRFRAAGITTEVLVEAGKPGAQFAPAEKKGIRWALIPGGEDSGVDADGGPVTLRDLQTRENRAELSVSAAIDFLKKTKNETGTRESN